MRENKRKIRAALGGLYPSREVEAIMRIIFDSVMGYSPVDMALHADDTLPGPASDKIDGILARLVEHEPIQYVIGQARFYGLRFSVDRSTLIPRPETERLVDMAVAGARGRSDLRALDIGTGSGCVAIALARTLKFPAVTATDISAQALEVAKRNARDLKVRVTFELSDILTATPPARPAYDIIVSNPPYITQAERAAMSRNVLDYEPHTALFAPPDDPLAIYRAITTYAASALKPGGSLYLETSPTLAAEVAAMLEKAAMTAVDTERDFNGLTRYLTATRPKPEFI